MAAWFLGDVTTVVKKDIYAEPSMFIKGKGSNNILDAGTEFPFITEVETSPGTNILAFLEPMRLFPFDPLFKGKDIDTRLKHVRFVGDTTKWIYMFINATPDASIAERTLVRRSQVVITVDGVIAKTTDSTLGIIIYEQDNGIIDPLLIAKPVGDQVVFSFPDQPENERPSNILQLNDENIVTGINIGYFRGETVTKAGVTTVKIPLIGSPLLFGTRPVSVGETTVNRTTDFDIFRSGYSPPAVEPT